MEKYDGFSGLEDIKKEFQSDCDGIKEEEILFASYGGGSWDGEAIVLVERDGKFYTSEGGHCSCKGLEDQWDLVETTKEFMKKRKISAEYHPKLIEFLKDW